MQANQRGHQNTGGGSKEEKMSCIILCNKKNVLLMFMVIYDLHKCPQRQAPYSVFYVKSSLCLY